MQKVETIGFQVRSLRQCFLDNKSLLPRQGPRKPNNGGLFAPDLMTEFAASGSLCGRFSPKLMTAEFSTLLLSL
jgi:hypothetical protein